MTRQIRADFDDEGIYVYQAFRPSTVAAALAHGTFANGFSMNRMTWIKPSFGWMLYRSGYASKNRQKAILKIKLTHAGFQEIIGQAIETSFNKRQHTTREDWKRALDASEVRVQWDPDRALEGYKLERRAIQLGIHGSVVEHYVHKWIIGLTEVTALAREIHQAVLQNQPLPTVPEEKIYPVNAEITSLLGITE